MAEPSAFDSILLAIRPVFNFMLALWDSLPDELRFLFAVFFGVAVGYTALRSFLL